MEIGLDHQDVLPLNGEGLVSNPNGHLRVVGSDVCPSAIAISEEHSASASGLHSNRTHTRYPKKQRRVQFSDISSLYITEARSEKDGRSSWYSSQERMAFKSQVAADAQRMRRIISLPPLDTSPYISHEDIIIHCVGLENFLSMDMTRTVVRNRQEHCNAIFREQAKQRELGVGGDEYHCNRFRHISEMGSLWATERALEFGTRYYHMPSI